MAKAEEITTVSEREVGVETAAKRPDHNIRAAVWAIFCGVALPCIPVIAVSAALLYIIFHHQVIPQPGWPELQIVAQNTDAKRSALQKLNDWRHDGGHPAYYVRYNPSTITTIAAWTGRVIPYLSSSIMALVAFFAARRIVTKSKHGDGSDLPTPEQLTLLISLLGGTSVGPLKDTLVHRWAKRERLIDPIPFAFYALLLVTSIAFMIPMIDTWFGIATTPDVVTQLYNASVSTYTAFGRTLSKFGVSSICPGDFTGFNGLEWMPCNLDWDHDSQFEFNTGIFPYLPDALLTSSTMQGMSDVDLVLNHTLDDGVMAFFLSTGGMNATLDYKARTYGVAAQCKPITKQCMPNHYPQDPAPKSEDEIVGYYKFDCSPGFRANYTFDGAVQTLDATPQDGGTNSEAHTQLVGLAFAPNNNFTERVGTYVPDLSNNILQYVYNGSYTATPAPHFVGSNWSYQYILPQNPINFAVWATDFPAAVAEGLSAEYEFPLLQDPQIFTDNSSLYWMLGCEATVYNLNYTWVNGSIHTVQVMPASPEVGGMVSGPFAFRLGDAPLALSDAANLAGSQNTSEALADVFARQWAKAAITLASGGFDFELDVIEQIRDSAVKVARVPLIPLWLLLGLKALYVVAVIILAIGAYCFTHPAETEVVKAQLSTKGLAAAHFDTPDVMQKNSLQEIQARLKRRLTNSSVNASTVVVEREHDQASDQPPPGEPDPKRKVGLVAHADGAWKFAVIADGVWSSIKPIAVNLFDMEADSGALGSGAQVFADWNK